MKPRDATAWRELWRERGERELALLLRSEWAALCDAPLDDYVAQGTRLATLLGSRAPLAALVAELGRMREVAGSPPDGGRDAAAAAAVQRWYSAL